MNQIHITDVKFYLIVGLQALGFIIVCFKLYAKSYSTEKGKNLATKQDIGDITQIVESIKASLTGKTEELKSELLYKNEHLIHIRASERIAIVNYYKSIWVLVLSLTRTDFAKYNLENYLEMSKIGDEIANFKYQRDIAESELMFFYDEKELNRKIKKLKLSISGFENALLSSIAELMELFTETSAKTRADVLISGLEIKKDYEDKLNEKLANWGEQRRSYYASIENLNDDLKKSLFERLKSLT